MTTGDAPGRDAANGGGAPEGAAGPPDAMSAAGPAVSPVAGAAAPLATPIFVVLNGVTARDAAGLRGASRGSLQAVSVALGPGVHVFLGAPEDGTIAICDVLAGVRAPLRGTVRVHGGDPWSSPPIRSCIGGLLAAPEVADARSVRDAVVQSLVALGRPAAEADGVLQALGVGALAARRPRSLSYAESRAVELALALHVAKTVAMRAAPPVLVLYEPCADVAVPSAARAVDDAIAAQRAVGACVIVATSSPVDARRLGDVVWVLHRGTLVRREAGDGRTLGFGDAEIAVWFGEGAGAQLRALAAAICAHPAVRAAYWDEPPAGSGRPATLRVRGPERDACALAVLDAAAAAHVAVEAITSATPDLASVRSASLAWLQRTRTAVRPPTGTPPVPGRGGQRPAEGIRAPLEDSPGAPTGTMVHPEDRAGASEGIRASGEDRAGAPEGIRAPGDDRSESAEGVQAPPDGRNEGSS